MRGQPQWFIKCLLDTCFGEINKVRRRGGSLHKESWTKFGMVLKERLGLDLTQKYMRNSYDNLRAKYIGYVYLRNKTGNIYNLQTNNFTFIPNEWEKFTKVHPKAGFLKTTTMPYPDLCVALNDGSSASGVNKGHLPKQHPGVHHHVSNVSRRFGSRTILLMIYMMIMGLVCS